MTSAVPLAGVSPWPAASSATLPYPPLRLTLTELIELTGYSQPRAQAEYVRKTYSVPAVINARGQCVVVRAHLEASHRMDDLAAPKRQKSVRRVA